MAKKSIGKIEWIHDELKVAPQLELTKHAVRVFTNNVLSLHRYTEDEREELATLFRDRIHKKDKEVSYDQTS